MFVKTKRLNFKFAADEVDQFRYMCLITNTSMTTFVRSAIKDKIKKIREAEEKKRAEKASSCSP
jgi:hypothetical protein